MWTAVKCNLFFSNIAKISNFSGRKILENKHLQERVYRNNLMYRQQRLFTGKNRIIWLESMEHDCLDCSSETNFREQRQSCFSVRNAQNGKFVNVFHFWDSSKPSLIPVSGLSGLFLVNGTDFTNSKLNKLTRLRDAIFQSAYHLPKLWTDSRGLIPMQMVNNQNLLKKKWHIFYLKQFLNGKNFVNLGLICCFTTLV